MSVPDEIVHALREHGILDYNANNSGSSNSHKSTEINIQIMWQLYKKVVADFEMMKNVQNKEMNELQRYVENVRGLSEERDRLTSEFDRENEALKKELKMIKDKQNEEETKITEMCHEEHMAELIGNTRTEQMAYLLLVRSNLLEKLEVTEKDLRSEDSELRNRMNTAMAEMGGMANKLTEATQERDRLKREVAHLNQTLSLVNGLPSNNVNNMEAKTQILALENSVNYYVGQIERLTNELENCKISNRTREAELTAELEELKEMNERYKDVNAELNKRLNIEDSEPPFMTGPSVAKQSTSVDNYLLAESQEKLQFKSKKLISEMEAALESEEKLAEQKEKKHQEDMSRMQERIRELEEIIKKNEERTNEISKETGISIKDVQELKAQLAETDRQYKVVKAEEAEYKEKYYKAQREFAKSEAGWKQCERQLCTQSEISYGLKQRNDELEIELSKYLTELQSSNEKQARIDVERKRLESEVTKRDDDIKEMEKHIADLKRAHDKEIRELKQMKDQSSKLKSYVSTENKRVSDIQIELTQAQTHLENEKGKRFTAEEQLESVRMELESMIRKKNELVQEIDEMQLRNESMQHKLILMTGKYEDVNGEKMVEEMSREQLEDVTNVMRVKLLTALDKSHNFAEKYRSLKQKHKMKIRKIRDLFMLERRATAEEVGKLELRVMLAESALEQELSWKQEAINEVRRAEEEHRKAIRREDEARKSAEDRSLELSRALDKNQDLSAENIILQSQLEHLESQKMEIERLVKKEHHKKELNTLLSSLSLSGSLPQNIKKIGNSETIALDESGFNETTTFHLEETGSGEKVSKLSARKTDL
ncbi:uncharacterized protein LOC144425616 isoform X2 [Styela clava]